MKSVVILFFSSIHFISHVFAGIENDMESVINLDGTLNLSTVFPDSLDLSKSRMILNDENGSVLSLPTLTAEWYPLGPGLNSPLCSAVNDILLDGADVYAAGSFTDAGGNPDADYIARWDGHAWHAIGPMLNNSVHCMAIDQHGFLYIAGDFTDAGGNPDADYLARWDRKEWQPLGRVLESPGIINALVCKGDDLYIGGWFTDFGGDPEADNIVMWDGQAWHAVGGGLRDEVKSIIVHGDYIYMGGYFIDAGGNADADRLVRWDGNTWHALKGITYGEVNDIAVLDDNLIYATGRNLLLKWDGSTWQNMNVNISGTGYALTLDAEYAYVSTYLALYRWSIASNTWDTYPPIQGFVKDIEVDGSDLYAAGWFYNAGGKSSADCIARWGDPDQQLTISGVPNVVCQGDPPFELPVVQHGISGGWAGPGVSNNIFYPQQVGDLITITFTPDTGQVFTATVTTDISVFHLDSLISWGILPNTICESSSPHPLFSYACQPGVPGVWSGQGIVDGYFNPAGLNGDVTLTFTPDFTLDVKQPINLGQCVVPPYMEIEVINFSAITPVIDCFDNGTPAMADDDIILLQVPPVGPYLDTVYIASVSSGLISPDYGNYKSSSYFQLQPGSAGGGNITLTLQDDDLPQCSFSFLIKDPGSCSLMSAEIIAEEYKSTIHVFPNPTQGIIWYSFEDVNKQSQTHTLTVMNHTGQKIRTTTQVEGQLDMSTWPAGMYYLKYEDQQNCVVVNVMKY